MELIEQIGEADFGI